MVNAIDLLDDAIAELEARLNLKPGEGVLDCAGAAVVAKKSKPENAVTKEKKQRAESAAATTAAAEDLPEICKLEFKVGVITKVWVHEKADKLYCEEIDVGEEEPRQIASGLRLHFTEEQMLGQRLLVVTNLKAKNLVGFKSHGMVLCAAEPIIMNNNNTTATDGVSSSKEEKVEFVEPPLGAAVGEIVTFDGLPLPQPWAASQVEKKKVFSSCCDGMKTTEDCVAAWNGHAFMTSAGPCKTKSIAGGVLR